jgi:hypothetical protein
MCARGCGQNLTSPLQTIKLFSTLKNLKTYHKKQAVSAVGCPWIFVCSEFRRVFLLLPYFRASVGIGIKFSGRMHWAVSIFAAFGRLKHRRCSGKSAVALSYVKGASRCIQCWRDFPVLLSAQLKGQSDEIFDLWFFCNISPWSLLINLKCFAYEF